MGWITFFYVIVSYPAMVAFVRLTVDDSDKTDKATQRTIGWATIFAPIFLPIAITIFGYLFLRQGGGKIAEQLGRKIMGNKE